MAPITDLKQRLGEVLAEKSMRELLPNLPQYFISGSPITYARDLKCPVFIAHAKDDDNEPFKNTQTYVSSLRDAGRRHHVRGVEQWRSLPSNAQYKCAQGSRMAQGKLSTSTR